MIYRSTAVLFNAISKAISLIDRAKIALMQVNLGALMIPIGLL